MKFAMKLALALITVAIAAIPTLQAQVAEPTPEAKPANPLEAAARAVGGIWVEESEVKNPDGKYVKTQTVWDVNQKALLSKAWQVSGDDETLVFEGGIYWHPKRKERVMWAVASNGAVMDGTVTPKDDTQTTVWTLCSEGMTLEGENRATYIDDDTITTDEFVKSQKGLQKTRTLRMVRQKEDWKPTTDKDSDGQEDAEPAKPSSLEESAKQVGGMWVADKGVADPAAGYNYFRADWGVGKKMLRSTTWAVKGGKTILLYGGAQYWHPGRNELTFHEIGRNGEVYIGRVVEQDGAQVHHFISYTSDAETRFEQHVRFEDKDTISSKVLMVKDGESKQVLTFKFVRKPDGWPKETAEKADKAGRKD
jgi:hypothetical protein